MASNQLRLLIALALLLLLATWNVVANGQQNSFAWPGESAQFSAAPSAVPSECDGSCGGTCQSCNQEPAKWMLGVDGSQRSGLGREPTWDDERPVPFENMAYGEYIGPFRTPHVPEYRLRIGDRLDFVYLLTSRPNGQPYQFYPGDTISLTSVGDPSLNQASLQILSDGTITLPLIGTIAVSGKTVDALTEELNQKFRSVGNVRDPRVIVQVIKGDTPLNDLRSAVVTNFGQNGQSRQVSVSPDGTVQLPLVGPTPAIGLTLREIAAEVNARYAQHIRGVNVNPILVERAPRSVYVLGRVNRPGRIAINGPTTVMQAIAQAEGWQTGSNLRQVIVFRRDENWQLVATRLDLQGALNGRRPFPSDDIWLRDSDIILIPKSPVQRFSEAVDLYMVRSLYSIFPQQGVVFNFDGFTSF